jgi:hypothetical protein
VTATAFGPGILLTSLVKFLAGSISDYLHSFNLLAHLRHVALALRYPPKEWK